MLFRASCFFLFTVVAAAFGEDPRDPISQSEEIFSPDSASITESQSPSDVPDTEFWQGHLDPVNGRGVINIRTLAGVGLVGLSNMEARNLSYHFSLGRFWAVPPYSAFRVWSEGITDFAEGHFLSVNIGGNLYTHRFETSPYFGLGTGFGLADGANESATGFNLSASVGIALFRESDRQLELELENKWLFGKLRQGLPSASLARLAVLF